jgi:formylglycine-generating enzyme required for sulfatase activity
VKWRECNAPITTGWTHGLLNTTLASHSFSNLEPTLSDGSAVGIDAAPNNTGTMLRRNASALYPSAGFTTVTLALTNLPTTGEYDIRVFGIEMVYVPQGAFVAGGTTESYAFHTNNSPFIINSEAATTFNYYSSSMITLPAPYPKGYDAFYCMKYEISQGQYADFLNTLDAAGQTALYYNYFNSYRNRLTAGGTPPNVYFSDRPDRAMNYLAWTDLLAYMDWACLRPMTELEFEKACRGNGPYVGGYAWGTTDIVEMTTVGTPEDGTEVSLTAGANAHYNGGYLSGGDGGNGPARVGIFATANTSSRVETGATYYGIMEMSGNVYEQVVTVYTDTMFTNFDGQWGDGYLDTTGHADVPHWPYANVAINASGYHRMGRGGGFPNGPTVLRVAERPYFLGVSTNNRTYNYGGRGVR